MTPAHDSHGAREADARGRLLLRLVPRLAHRLNNAFCVVEGMAEILSRSERDPEKRNYTRVLAEEAQKSAALLRGMALFSQAHEPASPAVDLAAVAAQAADLLRPLMFHGSQLSFETSGRVHVVRGDQRALLQILVLLLSEAAPERSPPGAAPRARVRCWDRGRIAGVSIATTPLEGCDQPSRDVVAAAASLAAQTGGRIRVRAAAGRGWVVRASFPSLAAAAH